MTTTRGSEGQDVDDIQIIASTASEWDERTGLARFLEVVLWAAPIIVSFIFLFVASRIWPPVELDISVRIWWLVFGLLTLLVFLAVDFISRRFLPLIALLRMNLAFPGPVPSRLSVALRGSTYKKFQARSKTASDSEVLASLIRVIGKHDKTTRGHSERVRAYSDSMARELKLTKDECDRLSWGALLHDVGKLAVPVNILNKPSQPDEAEWAVLQGHPGASTRYLRRFTGWLAGFDRAATEHHERWDGQGYPNGLQGEEIHISARIVACLLYTSPSPRDS